MVKRVPFSGHQLKLGEIISHHKDVKSSLRIYFDPTSVYYKYYQKKITEELESRLFEKVTEELECRLFENEQRTILSILSSLEAAFRIDYLQRVYKKKKDNLSRSFRELHKIKEERVSLKDEILANWKEHTNVPDKLIGDLKSAFNYRNWLAHGKYWEPKLGQKFDYESIYYLAATIFDSFQLEGI